jgi:hypothetical protein
MEQLKSGIYLEMLLCAPSVGILTISLGLWHQSSVYLVLHISPICRSCIEEDLEVKTRQSRQSNRVRTQAILSLSHLKRYFHFTGIGVQLRADTQQSTFPMKICFYAVLNLFHTCICNNFEDTLVYASQSALLKSAPLTPNLMYLPVSIFQIQKI